MSTAQSEGLRRMWRDPAYRARHRLGAKRRRLEGRLKYYPPGSSYRASLEGWIADVDHQLEEAHREQRDEASRNRA